MGKQMKNRSEKTINFIKSLAFGAVVVALMAVTVGCKKEKGSGSAGYRPGYGYGNPGYNSNGAINNVSAGMDEAGRYLLILATSGNSAQSGYYSGPTYVEGELRVFNGFGCPLTGMQTGLMPGLYQLRPYGESQAFLDVDLLQNAKVEAFGPGGSAIITIPYARTFSTNVCGMNGMMGLMTVEAVNGYPCGVSSGFTDMAPGGSCGY
jgi:hypothetical protein